MLVVRMVGERWSCGAEGLQGGGNTQTNFTLGRLMMAISLGCAWRASSISADGLSLVHPLSMRILVDHWDRHGTVNTLTSPSMDNFTGCWKHDNDCFGVATYQHGLNSSHQRRSVQIFLGWP